MLKRKNLFKILEVLILLLIAGIMLFSYLIKETAEFYLSSEIQVYGLIISFVISIFLEVFPQLIAPHFILLNTAILGFPNLASLITITTGATLGAIIGFEIGKHYGLDLTQKIYGEEKIKKIQNSLNKKGKWIVTLAALSPLPYIPIIFGSLGMSKKQFYLHGVIPRILGFIAVYFFVILKI